jgi:hypothetical protein
MAATLVYSSKWCDRSTIERFSDDYNSLVSSKLIEAIFKKRSTRFIIKGDRYYYQPSDEYKKFVVRFKKVR